MDYALLLPLLEEFRLERWCNVMILSVNRDQLLDAAVHCSDLPLVVSLAAADLRGVPGPPRGGDTRLSRSLAIPSSVYMSISMPYMVFAAIVRSFHLSM